MKNFGIIYKVTNILNGKIYIGQTIRGLEVRGQCHISESKNGNTYFNRALRKYCPENFEWEVIEECYSKEDLDLAEEWYIRYYNTFGSNGYNLTFGGEGTIGWKPSEETRKKISKSMCGENNPNYGKERSEEYRKKLSDTLKGRKHSEGHKRKLSEVNKGKKLSEETRKKMGESRKGEKNVRAKKRVVIRPDGRKYFCHGTFTKLCKEFSKEFKKNMLRFLIDVNKSGKEINGWVVFDVDDTPTNENIIIY